jgi:amino acid transporter
MSSVTTPQDVPQDRPEEVEVVGIEGHGSTVLKSNALGPAALFFCIATAAAPFTALLFNTPVIASGSGYAVPAAFIIGAVMLLIFTVGYLEMAKRVTTAGGFYAFVSHGFGRVAGLGTAALITFSYVLLVAALVGVFAYFANTTLEAWFSISIPVWVFLFGALAVNLLFVFFDVQITARILGGFFLAEVTVALLFAVIVLVQGGDAGLSAKPLNPLEVFDNSSAIAVFGAAAPGIALFGAFWSWVGFEMGPNYGEEAKDGKRIFAPATYATLLILAFIYIFVTYAFVIGWGVDNAAKGVAGQFNGDYASAYYPLTDRYAGGWLTTAFEGLIITSAFACQLAFFNTAARYVFALGRERILPAALGRTHDAHKTPHAASVAVAAVVALYIAGFLIYDSSTEAALLKLGTWTPLVGVLGILLIQALVSFAIVRYFLTTGKEYARPLRTLVAPLLGGALMLFSSYLLIDNREVLAGADGVAFVQAVPWIVAVVFLLGVVAGLWFRYRDAVRYQAVGRFVYEDA